MPPRSSWKGSISLHLVSVPVKAYTANVSGAQTHLNQLHTDCHSQIKYRKICPIHGELSRDAIVSGYEYAKGQFVEDAPGPPPRPPPPPPLPPMPSKKPLFGGPNPPRPPVAQLSDRVEEVRVTAPLSL